MYDLLSHFQHQTELTATISHRPQLKCSAWKRSNRKKHWFSTKSFLYHSVFSRGFPLKHATRPALEFKIMSILTINLFKLENLWLWVKGKICTFIHSNWLLTVKTKKNYSYWLMSVCPSWVIQWKTAATESLYLFYPIHTFVKEMSASLMFPKNTYILAFYSCRILKKSSELPPRPDEPSFQDSLEFGCTCSILLNMECWTFVWSSSVPHTFVMLKLSQAN